MPPDAKAVLIFAGSRFTLPTGQIPVGIFTVTSCISSGIGGGLREGAALPPLVRLLPDRHDERAAGEPTP